MKRIVRSVKKVQLTTPSKTNEKKFVSATEPHFKYINTILADLSKQTKKEQKRAYHFKRWLLDLVRNMRLHGNIVPEKAKELYKHYKRVMYKYEVQEGSRVVFESKKMGGDT